MSELCFDYTKCTLCGTCVEKCPFGALEIKDGKVSSNENCRICGACVRVCEEKAISIEEKVKEIDKSEWQNFLIYVEQERGDIHPVVYELVGEAKKMAAKVGFKVNCVMVGPEGTKENANKLLEYGVDEVYVYEHPFFEGFKVDAYSEAIADCINDKKPSSILIGATSLGRSLAPRLATRFKTGLTADCTTLDIQENTDMLQIRPAFGGNIMAQILIAKTRPQFATVRYRVMDKAKKVDNPTGIIEVRNITNKMLESSIEIISSKLIEKKEAIEEADVIVAIGRGVKNEEGIEMCKELAKELGATLAFTRPLIENGVGDNLFQIGLSGHTVRPSLIITIGISGAIQFVAGMSSSETIVAINNDPNAQIFNVASYCIVDDLYEVVPKFTKLLKERKED